MASTAQDRHEPDPNVGGSEPQRALWSALEQTLADPEASNAFDVFGAAPPDEALTGVFDPRAESSPRYQGVPEAQNDMTLPSPKTRAGSGPSTSPRLPTARCD